MESFTSANIRRKPSYLAANTAQAFLGYIFMPKSMIEDLNSANPDKRLVALFEHERVHIKRAAEVGVWRWHVRYMLNPRFRFNEEVVAYRTQFAVLNRYGIKPDVIAVARKLSGKLYLWPVSYQVALKELNQFNEYNE